ncbi:interleukin-6 isoform X3 [Puntigrus tetrazona]|uniref:interleukin-6 isoform X3 n=1 Tax=Puntigrus tetrazona TaxID=1606681 RepID=UPI001C8A15A6|nr:interleukin-6 isoform X3 [Puntigrus tetrazona]
MRSAQNAALFLSAVAAALLARLHALPVHGGLPEPSQASGDEVQDVNGKSPLSDRLKWNLMARDLHRDVKSLRDQQFERDFKDAGNMTEFESVRIETPLLRPSDGCLSRNFSSDLCLSRISGVLSWYKDHWSFVENENLTSSLVNGVRLSTKRLLEAIDSQVRSVRLTPAVPAALFPQLQPADQVSSAPLTVSSAWTRKTVAHSLLYNFTSVMIDTCRAVNYMSKHRAARRAEDAKRPAEDKN